MNKNKFTLIEVLVVVAIIGILASLLLPSLGKARQKARKSVCVSQLKQIGLGMVMYAGDNDDRIMPCQVDRNFKYSKVLRDDYDLNEEIFYCPVDDVERTFDIPRSYSLNTGSDEDVTTNDGPSRWGSYDTSTFAANAQGTILAGEKWVAGNGVTRWQASSTNIAEWNRVLRDKAIDWHEGIPVFLFTDGSVRARYHATIQDSEFTSKHD